MEEKYKEAFAEIDQIIQIMPVSLSNKIPLKFKQIISNAKSNIYIPEISEPIEKCSLKKETMIILSLIYRDFLCSNQEKHELLERDKRKLIEEEEELQKKYNPDNMFKKRKICENKIEKSMVVVEEKWYQKIWKLLKIFFRKN